MSFLSQFAAHPMNSWPQNTINLTIALVVDFLAAVCIVAYLFFSFALLQYAKAKNGKHRWVAFLPFGQFFYFALLLDRQSWKKKKQSILFLLSLVSVSGCVISLCLYFINDRFPFLKGGSTLLFGGFFALFFLLALVVLYLCVWRMFGEAEPDLQLQSFLFSAIMPLAMPILFYRASLLMLPKKPRFALAESKEASLLEELPTSAAETAKKPEAAEKPKKFVVHLPDEDEE